MYRYSFTNLVDHHSLLFLPEPAPATPVPTVAMSGRPQFLQRMGRPVEVEVGWGGDSISLLGRDWEPGIGHLLLRVAAWGWRQSGVSMGPGPFDWQWLAAQPGLPNPSFPVGALGQMRKQAPVGTAPRPAPAWLRRGIRLVSAPVRRQPFVQGGAVWPGRQRRRRFQRWEEGPC